MPPRANVKVVQRMLGHSSAAMTLDCDTDLFELVDDARLTGCAQEGRQPIMVLDNLVRHRTSYVDAAAAEVVWSRLINQQTDGPCGRRRTAGARTVCG
jgi:hypothetical protein